LNDGAATRGLPPLAALPVPFYLYLAGFWPLILLPGTLSHFPIGVVIGRHHGLVPFHFHIGVLAVLAS
jgi:hypothetical protein